MDTAHSCGTRKEHRAERHSALVEGLFAQICSGVELVDLPRKLHGGLLCALVQQAVLAVLTEQRTAVGHQRLFPAVIVDAELVNDAVPVRVSRQLLTQAVKLIPRPIVIRDADVLFWSSVLLMNIICGTHSSGSAYCFPLSAPACNAAG